MYLLNHKFILTLVILLFISIFVQFLLEKIVQFLFLLFYSVVSQGCVLNTD